VRGGCRPAARAPAHADRRGLRSGGRAPATGRSLLDGAPEPAGRGHGMRRQKFVAALGGLAIAVLVGGWPGLVAGVVVAALLARYLGRLEPAGRRRERGAATVDLPYAAD